MDVPVMALTLVVPFDPLKQLVFVDTKTGVNELGAITKTVPDAAQTGVVAFKVYTPGAALTKVVLVFVDENEFLQMVNNSSFVEHAQVFNHYYGTSAAQIMERLKSGIDVVLDIDWHGAKQIKGSFADAVSIFVIPPSLEILKERLKNRQQDDSKTIAGRMHCAQDELSHYK